MGELFLNDGLRLLKIVDIVKSGKKPGIALQEALGYVIFLEFEQLNNLKPFKTFKDPQGLTWDVLPNDITGAEAINEIGDKISGMKEIQQIIDGSAFIE